MLQRLLALLFFTACAGPAAHRSLAGSAAEPTAEAARRPQVASTLAPVDPLGAPTCALPTAPQVPCAEAAAPAHHHGGEAPPAPADPHQHHRTGEGVPPPTTPADPHQHHRSGEAPPPPTTPADPHQQHRGGEAPPAPKAPADPHQHHRGGAASPVDAPSQVAPPPSGKVVDPICKMTIDAATAKGGSAQLDGKTFFFCSSSCRRAFFTQHPGAR